MKEYSSSLELELFGTFEARIDGASLLRSLFAKGKALLAYMAVHSGRPIASAVIAEEVFPDSRSDDPHEIIKKTVQEIRKALGAESWRLQTPSNRAFLFDIEGARVDWKNFLNSLNKGDEESLQHAIALHARLFLETESLPWAKAERTMCLKFRQDALESLFRFGVNSGEESAAASSLSRQFDFETPFLFIKEALWREFLELLFRKQEYGLMHYHYAQLQSYLERTAGRPPEQSTQDIYQKIPKSSLVRILQNKDKKRKNSFPESAQFPRFPFPLLGREKERRALKNALASSRSLTLCGIGGVGKTRLAAAFAQEISSEFNEEIGFIDLTSATPDTLLQTLSTALEVKTNASQNAYDSLKSRFSKKPTLLVLDNCERLVAEVADLADSLLRDCPKLVLLVTSREALGLASERVFFLKPLQTPAQIKISLNNWAEFPALRLFVERVEFSRPDFEVSESNLHSVVELCKLVDGLPLGIEIVASQVANLPLSRISASLEDCVLHVKHCFRGAPAKHQTLGAALSWSYNDLCPEEKKLFRRLSVFSGGWTLEDAEQICSDEEITPSEILAHIASLTRKSLVSSQFTEGDSLRYYFLETIRRFAWEQLTLEGESKRFQFRHLERFLFLAENASRNFDGPREVEWIDRLKAEQENLRKSLQFCFAKEATSSGSPLELEDALFDAHCLRLCVALWRFWDYQGSYEEGVRWLEKALKTPQTPENEIAYAYVLQGAGNLYDPLGEFEKSRECLERSLAIWRRHGKEYEEALALDSLGIIYDRRGETQEAIKRSEEALALLRRLNIPMRIVGTLNNLGIMARHAGRLPLARERFEEALAINRLHGNSVKMAKLIMNAASVSSDERNYDSALSLYEKSFALFTEAKLSFDAAFSAMNIANVLLHKGETAASKRRYIEALKEMRRSGEARGIIFCLKGLAVVAAREGQDDLAAALLGATQAMLGNDAVFEQSQNPIEFAEIQALQLKMGTQAFDDRRLIGRSLTTNEAVELALKAV